MERAGERAVLLLPPRATAFQHLRRTPGRRRPAPLRPRRRREHRGILRADAAALGLPPRRALGRARAHRRRLLGRWGVAVVTTAEPRSRSGLARGWRLVAGELLAGGLVFAFGTAALRGSGAGCSLQRELALAALARERDERARAASRAADAGHARHGHRPRGLDAASASSPAAPSSSCPSATGDERAARAVRAILDQAERIRRRHPRLPRPRARRRAGARRRRRRRACSTARSPSSSTASRKRGRHAATRASPTACRRSTATAACSSRRSSTCCSTPATPARAAAASRSPSRSAEGMRRLHRRPTTAAASPPEEAARATEPFFTTKAPGRAPASASPSPARSSRLHRGSLDARARDRRTARARRSQIPLAAPEACKCPA